MGKARGHIAGGYLLESTNHFTVACNEQIDTDHFAEIICLNILLGCRSNSLTISPSNVLFHGNQHVSSLIQGGVVGRAKPLGLVNHIVFTEHSESTNSLV